MRSKRTYRRWFVWVAVAILVFLVFLMTGLPKGAFGYAWQRVQWWAKGKGQVPLYDELLPVVLKQASRDLAVLDSTAEIQWSATTRYPRPVDQQKIESWDKSHASKDLEG